MELDKIGIALGNTPEDMKNRKKFITNFYVNWIIANPTKQVFNKSLIHIMGYEKETFGKIKLTVGELRGSCQKVQYCITAIENDY